VIDLFPGIEQGRFIDMSDITPHGAKLDPLCLSRSAGEGKMPGKTFGILRRSVSKIADAGSTIVLPGIFPSPAEITQHFVGQV
jgi:hypothetical protein